MLQYKQQLFLNPRVEYLNDRDISLDSVGKRSNKKTTNSNLDSLGAIIKAWSGLANREDRIKSLKGNLELTDELNKAIRMDKAQKS